MTKKEFNKYLRIAEERGACKKRLVRLRKYGIKELTPDDINWFADRASILSIPDIELKINAGLFRKQGSEVYTELNDGRWRKTRYDKEGLKIYCVDSEQGVLK